MLDDDDDDENIIRVDQDLSLPRIMSIRYERPGYVYMLLGGRLSMS